MVSSAALLAGAVLAFYLLWRGEPEYLIRQFPPVVEARKRIAELAVEINEQKLAVQEVIESKNREIESKNRDIELLKAAEGKIAAIFDELEKQKHNFEQSQKQVEQLREQIRKNEITISGITDALAAAQNEAAQVKVGLEAERKKSGELDVQNKRLISQAEETVKRHQQELATKDGDIALLRQAAVEASKKWQAERESLVAQAREAYDEIKKELQDKQDGAAQLKQTIETQNNENAMLKTQIAQLKQTIETQQNENIMLNQELVKALKVSGGRPRLFSPFFRGSSH